MLIKKVESTGLNDLNNSKAFIEYSNDMDDICKHIEEYSAIKTKNINFYLMIADMLNNKKLNSIVTELFIRDRKLNISLAFVTQSYFSNLENIRLNSMHYLRVT